MAKCHPFHWAYAMNPIPDKSWNYKYLNFVEHEWCGIVVYWYYWWMGLPFHTIFWSWIMPNYFLTDELPFSKLSDKNDFIYFAKSLKNTIRLVSLLSAAYDPNLMVHIFSCCGWLDWLPVTHAGWRNFNPFPDTSLIALSDFTNQCSSRQRYRIRDKLKGKKLKPPFTCLLHRFYILVFILH